MGGEVELKRGFAGPISASFVGLMKYAIVCLPTLEFVITLCSAPMSLPLLIIYIRYKNIAFCHTKCYYKGFFVKKFGDRNLGCDNRSFNVFAIAIESTSTIFYCDSL